MSGRFKKQNTESEKNSSFKKQNTSPEKNATLNKNHKAYDIHR